MSGGDLIHNERLKALAAFFHNLGVTAIGGGAFVPLFAANLGKDPDLKYLVVFPVGLALGACLAGMGQMILGLLRSE